MVPPPSPIGLQGKASSRPQPSGSNMAVPMQPSGYPSGMVVPCIWLHLSHKPACAVLRSKPILRGVPSAHSSGQARGRTSLLSRAAGCQPATPYPPTRTYPTKPPDLHQSRTRHGWGRGRGRAARAYLWTGCNFYLVNTFSVRSGCWVQIPKRSQGNVFTGVEVGGG
jgi:hypothetical protein